MGTLFASDLPVTTYQLLYKAVEGTEDLDMVLSEDIDNAA